MIHFTKFSPKALDFIEHADARLNILHGSVRSSKTINCSVRWLRFLADGPEGDLFMIGKTIATLQRNVLNDIRDIVGEANFHWVNRQQGELRLFHRRIYCIGANNEDAESKIRGATIAGAYCDEVSLYPESFFAQLMARMSIEGAQCFCNCNPDTPYHWFYVNYIINDSIKNKKVWHFTMDDNLSLSEEYKTSLKQMYRGVFRQRLIDGIWCVAEGAIYDMFEPAIHVKKIPLTSARLVNVDPQAQFVIRWFVSCDYATSSVMTFSLFAELRDSVFYKRAEYYYDATGEQSQKTDSQFLKEFRNWLSNYPEVKFAGGVSGVYVDPAAASWKLELLNAGYLVYSANNDVINGIRVVGNLFTLGKFFIDPSCVCTVREYSGYSWDPAAQKLGIDRPIKSHDHTCDADRYFLYTYTENRFAGVY